MRWSFRKALGLPTVTEPLAPATPPVPEGMRVKLDAVEAARLIGRGGLVTPWTLPEPAPDVTGGLATHAMDWAPSIGPLYSWAQDGMYAEGLGFLGFPYLAELAQRSEYRQGVLKYAEHATRKWIDLRGGTSDDRRKQLWDAMERLKVREVFRTLIEHDGFFGRGQCYIDVGTTSREAQARPLVLSEYTLKGKLRALKAIEPVWCYPGRYNSTDPLRDDWYNPQEWYVSGRTVHASRMLMIVGAPLPDMLKPAYAFAGLARTQMAKPYVDNWLRTRQSVSDITHSFSVMVLKTDMAATLAATTGAGQQLANRVELFNTYRDNGGTWVVDKESEDFSNVSAPLASLDKLQAQAQEHMAAVFAIPLVELLGITPSGLNASSDGEIRTFYANVKGYLERTVREPLTKLMDIIQLSEFGDIDRSITFEFLDLWETSELDAATVQKTRADTHATYVNMGAVSNDEVREVLSDDESGPYHGIDLSGAAPDMEEGEDDGDDT